MGLKRWFSALLLLLVGVLHASPARAGDDEKLAALGQKARVLAERLQSALDPDQCRSVTYCRVTMAVGILDDGAVLIATSEPGNTLRSPLEDIRKEVGAQLVRYGSGDAEEKIVRYPSTTLFQRNRKVLVVAAGRPICEKCERIIVAAGAKPASPCRSGKRY